MCKSPSCACQGNAILGPRWCSLAKDVTSNTRTRPDHRLLVGQPHLQYGCGVAGTQFDGIYMAGEARALRFFFLVGPLEESRRVRRSIWMWRRKSASKEEHEDCWTQGHRHRRMYTDNTAHLPYPSWRPTYVAGRARDRHQEGQGEKEVAEVVFDERLLG